ncbi:MAG: hypothetical protein SFV15_15855 [Polyangiaceae bacterium]|nr:hypothetical protein [Polyangiaceae bacterium]
MLRSVLLFLLLLLVSVPCRAENTPEAPTPRQHVSARLLYAVPTVPNNCPAQSVLEAAVSNRLGYQAFDPSAAAILLANVEMNARGLVGKVSLQTEERTEGVRELRTSSFDCNELIQSMALAISVALDPLLEASEPPAQPSATPAPGPSPAVGSGLSASPMPAPLPAFAPTFWPAPAPAPPPQASVFPWQLEAAAGVSPSLLPRTAYAASLGLRYASSGLEIGAGALGAFSPKLVRPNNTGVQANAWLGHAEVCVPFSFFAACLPSYVGVVAAQGSGFAQNYSETEFMATTGLGASGRLEVSERWALKLGVAGLVSYAPLTFKTDRSTLWQQPRVLTLFQAGATFRL